MNQIDWKNRGAGDLGYIKYGVFPEQRSFCHYSVSSNHEKELRNAVKSAMFDKICEAIPGLEPWVRKGKSRATTNSFVWKINAIWRSFVKKSSRGFELFCCWRCSCSNKPLYGRMLNWDCSLAPSRKSNIEHNR